MEIFYRAEQNNKVKAVPPTPGSFAFAKSLHRRYRFGFQEVISMLGLRPASLNRSQVEYLLRKFCTLVRKFFCNRKFIFELICYKNKGGCLHV